MSGSLHCDPLISVIVPAYNAEASIAETLDSVLAQTYSNFEVLVVDDGSQDRTGEIVAAYTQKNRRIRLLRQQNAGVAAARNFAIASAEGDFIAPIDADDVWYPDNLALQVRAMQRGGPTVGLVYSWSIDIDESGQPTGGFRAAQITGDVYTTLIGHNFVGNASATMMRWSCLNEVGGYDPELRAQDAQGCEDWDLYLRIAERYKFRAVPQFLIGYRKVSNSMSVDYQSMAKSHALVMTSVQRQHPYLPQYLFKLSSSNLYMYFAHQSNRYRRHGVTRLWLKEALAAETVTPFIRLGFYRLLLNSTWGSLEHRIPVSKPLSRLNKSATSRSERMRAVEAPFKPSQLTLSLMLTVGSAFHWLVATLVRMSETRLADS